MTDRFVTARNTVSGKVGVVPAGYLDHPHFKNQYVPVEDGAKDFVPSLYTPKTADEFDTAHQPAEIEDTPDEEYFDDEAEDEE